MSEPVAIPDLGILIHDQGIVNDNLITFACVDMRLITRVIFDEYTFQSFTLINKQVFAATFAFGADTLPTLLKGQPVEELKRRLLSCNYVTFDPPLILPPITCSLGPLTQGEHASFRPLQIVEVEVSH